MATKRGLVVVAIAGLVGVGRGARADVDIKFGGQIASDIRFRLGGEEVPPASPTARCRIRRSSGCSSTAFRATRTSSRRS